MARPQNDKILNVMFWNSRGIRNKFTEFLHFVQEEDLDIVGVNETFLNDSCILQANNYEIIRADKTCHSGGLLFMIKNGINFDIVNCPPTNLFECMAIEVKSLQPFILSLVYCQGTTSLINSNYSRELSDLCHQSRPFFVMGDFNSKHRAWNCVRNNRAGTLLYDFITQSQYFLNFPDEPTYSPVSTRMTPSTIDLVITDGQISCSQPEVVEKFTSDHFPVKFEINCDYTIDGQTSSFFNYSTANWPNFRSQLSNSIEVVYNQFHSQDKVCNATIDNLIENITAATLESQQNNIPQYSNKKSDFIVTPELKSLISYRNYYRTKYNRSKHPSDKLNYIELKNKVNNLICHLKRDKLNKILLDCNQYNNNIFKVIKTKRHINLPPLQTSSPGQRLITSKKAKANELANNFLKNHSNPLENHIPTHTNKVNKVANKFLKSNQDMHIPTVTSHDISEILRHSKSGKASGLDSVNIRVVKNFPILAIKFLAMIFNFCHINLYFPVNWKIAKTIAIPKPGKDRKLAQSYRPIALLSCFSKIYEKIILTQFKRNLASINPLPNVQFGFRPGHSTSHALKYLTDQIKSGLDSRKTIGVIYFDVQKAFDLVWHNGLIYKMIQAGFDPWLIKIIASFLQNRKFEVHVGDTHSDRHEIFYGVPQGSVLSPNLFSLFTSDIPIRNDEINVSLYADDTTIFGSHRFIKTLVKRLKAAAARIIKFYGRWKLSINAEKTVVSFHTRRKTKQLPPHSVRIGGLDVPVTKDVRYLGMYLDNTLTMGGHIDKAILKANIAGRRLYPYMRRFSFATKKLKLKIYKSYIRPIVMYGAPILAGASKSRRAKLQVFQNKYLRMVMNRSRFTRIKELHDSVRIEYTDEFLARLNTKFISKCRESENQIINNMLR